MISLDVTKKLHGASGALNLSFQATIKQGELVAIYGPSGAGKTSILRMLAGLMAPDEGILKVGDQVWFDHKQKIFLPPQQRDMGMVFQEYTLFPNMTVRGNLEFALNKGQSKSIVEELLELTALDQLQHQKPLMLSGGQKQRVALARALVQKPSLLLLDEPLSALDAAMRQKLQDYILQVHKQFGLTTVLVSHELTEIIKLSNRVFVIEDGSVTNEGPALDVLPLDHLRALLDRPQHKGST